MGCAIDNLGCCPLNFSAALTSCPADYTTTGVACCPSYVRRPKNFCFCCYANAGFWLAYRGWSIYSTNLGGETPCYSSLLIPVSNPTATLTLSNVPNAPISTVTISDYVFTDKFALQPSTPSGIGETAKVGIGVGVVLGVCLGAILIFGFFHLKRNRPSRDPQGSPMRAIYIPSKPELDGIALQELESSRGPGRRIELQDNVWELGP